MGLLAGLYRRFPTLLIARRNLTRTTARTALAALGIVIGVVAIASLGVFGSVLQTAAVGNLGGIGNQVVVSPNAEANVTELTERDVRTIRRVAGDASVVPLKRGGARVSYRTTTTGATVYGIAEPARAFDATAGRIPTPLRSGVLVGAALAEELGVEPGDSLTVGDRTYRVRAILAEQPGFSPLNVGGGVVVPSDDVNTTGFQQVVVRADTGAAANATAAAVRERLNDREQRVTVFEFSQIVEQINSFFDTLSLFLIGLGSISLVVAGVSILNVMLMSTIERREEIGVLRAVGYRRRDVLKILLTEAALLGVVGGVAGVGLSVLAGAAIAQVALGDATAALAPDVAVYYVAAFGFGIVTSVVSGLYPAWKAARERPVDALRS